MHRRTGRRALGSIAAPLRDARDRAIRGRAPASTGRAATRCGPGDFGRLYRDAADRRSRIPVADSLCGGDQLLTCEASPGSMSHDRPPSDRIGGPADHGSPGAPIRGSRRSRPRGVSRARFRAANSSGGGWPAGAPGSWRRSRGFSPRSVRRLEHGQQELAARRAPRRLRVSPTRLGTARVPTRSPGARHAIHSAWNTTNSRARGRWPRQPRRRPRRPPPRVARSGRGAGLDALVALRSCCGTRDSSRGDSRTEARRLGDGTSSSERMSS